jgi:hypothetical protein
MLSRHLPPLLHLHTSHSNTITQAITPTITETLSQSRDTKPFEGFFMWIWRRYTTTSRQQSQLEISWDVLVGCIYDFPVISRAPPYTHHRRAEGPVVVYTAGPWNLQGMHIHQPAGKFLEISVVIVAGLWWCTNAIVILVAPCLYLNSACRSFR